jgi:hypothetical protein
MYALSDQCLRDGGFRLGPLDHIFVREARRLGVGVGFGGD